MPYEDTCWFNHDVKKGETKIDVNKKIWPHNKICRYLEQNKPCPFYAEGRCWYSHEKKHKEKENMKEDHPNKQRRDKEEIKGNTSQEVENQVDNQKNWLKGIQQQLYSLTKQMDQQMEQIKKMKQNFEITMK